MLRISVKINPSKALYQKKERIKNIDVELKNWRRLKSNSKNDIRTN